MFTRTTTSQDAAHGVSGAEGDGDRPGLVLLYASDWARLPRAFVLRGNVIAGRQVDLPHLCLPLHAVSRVHARFSKCNTTWTVSDQSSRNGTFVNGQRVTTCPLADGDLIRIGDAIYKFVERGADDHLPFPVDGGIVADPEPESGALRGGLHIHRVLDLVRRVSKTSLSVLVHGETGTGKELVARAVHGASERAGDLSTVNSAALPSGLVEAELFGVRRGAFTGATHDRPGFVRAAHGGTLMLDEIGDMSLDMQAKVLRVIETREVTPVGSARPFKVDFRLVSATHRDLAHMVEKGTFRGDLYARINACIIELLPLRSRKEDIFLLARHFATSAGRPDAPMSFGFVAALLAYDWPFNVRELEAAIRRAVAMAGEAELDVKHLPRAVVAPVRERPPVPSDRAAPPTEGSPGVSGGSLSPPVDELRALLVRHHGNIAAVARALGKDRAQVHRWLRYAGIDATNFR